MRAAPFFHLRLAGAAISLCACGAGAHGGVVAPAAPNGVTPSAVESPQLPELSSQRVLNRIPNGGEWFAASAGSLWVAADVGRVEGAGGTPQLWRFDASTGRLPGTPLNFAENITDVQVAGGVVRVLTRHQLTLLDADSMAVVARVRLPGGADRLAIGVGADWIADAGGTVLRVDQRSHAIAATVRVTSASVAAGQDNGIDGGEPSWIALSGGAVWAVLDAEQRVARIDPGTNTVAASFALPFGGVSTMQPAVDGGVWLDFFDDGRFAHVSSGGAVDTLPFQVPQPTGFVVRGNDLWFVSHRIGELWRVDMTSHRVLERTTVGAPGGAVVADGNTVWVQGGRNLTHLDVGADVASPTPS